MGSKTKNPLIDTSLFQEAREAVDQVTEPSQRSDDSQSDRREEIQSTADILGEPWVGPETGKALVNVSGLVKHYGDGGNRIPVLREVNLRVYRGEMVAVMGPSGCGKSTLLFILGLFLSPSHGAYHFDGEDVLKLGRAAQAAFRRNRVGFVFQTSDLLANTTVYENLEFPLIYEGVERGRRSKRIWDALQMVNLEHRIRHPANMLSGGERQRVAVARALVNRPQVILADEPTGQLDLKNTQLIMNHFEDIVRGGKTAVIVVTHDPEVAERCTRISFLNDGVIEGG